MGFRLPGSNGPCSQYLSTRDLGTGSCSTGFCEICENCIPGPSGKG